MAAPKIQITDHFMKWERDCCETDAKCKLSLGDLYESYSAWCDRESINPYKPHDLVRYLRVMLVPKSGAMYVGLKPKP